MKDEMKLHRVLTMVGVPRVKDFRHLTLLERLFWLTTEYQKSKKRELQQLKLRREKRDYYLTDSPSRILDDRIAQLEKEIDRWQTTFNLFG